MERKEAHANYKDAFFCRIKSYTECEKNYIFYRWHRVESSSASFGKKRGGRFRIRAFSTENVRCEAKLFELRIQLING